MKSVFRVILGKAHAHAEECFAGGFIGTDFEPNYDLTSSLTEKWPEFRKVFVPKYLDLKPEKTKISAGLACGALWTVSIGIKKGDVVLCPDGKGSYYVGEVSGDYFFKTAEVLPHRRPVRWFDRKIEKSEMTKELQNSAGSIGTVASLQKYTEEIRVLMGETQMPAITTLASLEDNANFVFEKHLEDFLVKNWDQTELGKKYDIYEEDGELVGQQYPTDTGDLDILAISKDKKELLVVELKNARACDQVVGQIQRYMGFVAEELASEGQIVKGVIVAPEESLRIRRALSVTQNIEFYQFQISFKLFKPKKAS